MQFQKHIYAMFQNVEDLRHWIVKTFMKLTILKMYIGPIYLSIYIYIRQIYTVCARLKMMT